MFIAHIYFLERLLRHSLCVSSVRTGTQLCWMPALQTNSSQLQDPEDSRPHSPLSPGYIYMPGLAHSCYIHGHSAAWQAKTFAWSCPRGPASVARLRDRFQRPETGAPQEGARKNYMTGAAHCLSVFQLRVQDVLWQSVVGQMVCT